MARIQREALGLLGNYRILDSRSQYQLSVVTFSIPMTASSGLACYWRNLSGIEDKNQAFPAFFFGVITHDECVAYVVLKI